MLTGNRISLITLVALSSFTVAGSASAQSHFGNQGSVAGTSNPGRVTDDNSVEICGTSGGGTRTRPNCTVETETIRTEHELKIAFDLNTPPPTAECEAVATTEYRQQNTVALVESKLELRDCAAAATGDFTFAVRVRDDAGEIKPLEFKETWERTAGEDVNLAR